MEETTLRCEDCGKKISTGVFCAYCNPYVLNEYLMEGDKDEE